MPAAADADELLANVSAVAPAALSASLAAATGLVLNVTSAAPPQRAVLTRLVVFDCPKGTSVSRQAAVYGDGKAINR